MRMLVEWIELGYLSLATSTITLTITRAKVARPVRNWISNRSSYFGEMINCPYCTSHWIAFALCAVYHPRPFPLNVVLDWFLSSMAIVAISSILSGIVFEAISKVHLPKEG